MGFWSNRNEAFLQKIKAKSPRVCKLAESNYGRDDGWYIEFEGEVIGELVHPKFENMFWDSYKIIPSDEKYNDLLFSESEWLKCEFKFRNKELNEYASGAFPAGSQNDLLKKKRVVMRALYLHGNNETENDLIRSYSDVYNKKKEQAPFTSKKFGTIRLRHSLKSKKIEHYVIDIDSEGDIHYRYLFEDGKLYGQGYEMKDEVLKKIQNLVDKFNVFEISSKAINSWSLAKRLCDKLLKKGSRSISITNDLEEKHLDFEIIHWRMSKEQKELLLFFEEIETLIKLGLPENSFVH